MAAFSLGGHDTGSHLLDALLQGVLFIGQFLFGRVPVSEVEEGLALGLLLEHPVVEYLHHVLFQELVRDAEAVELPVG